MKTPFPEKMSEAEALRAFADQCVKSPAIYLMALRAHVMAQSRKVVGDLFDTVSDAIPAPAKTEEQQ